MKMTEELIKFQDRELAILLRKIFDSWRWKIIRQAHPGMSDELLLHQIIGIESLRCSVGAGSPIEFYASEFERCR